MKCKECAEGRRLTEIKILCILYGMILHEDHECTQKGGRRRERDADAGDGGRDARDSGDGGN